MNGTNLFREEAIRLKAIAVEMYKAGDLVGAKEFAFRAQRYDPTLYGLVRLNAVLDVRLGFAKKVNDQVSWYAVLSVDPTADLETVRESYRKISLDIILDDDNSVGSIEEANQILDNAWKHLCNAKGKQDYDESCKVWLQNVAASGTFWTMCHYCGIQYEYQSSYKDHVVVCSQCSNPFRATERPAIAMGQKFPWTYAMKRQLHRKRNRQFSSWAVSSTEPEVEVKKNLFLVTELRRIRADAGIRNGKLMLPPNMIRNAMPGKSKSMITEEEKKGDEKRTRV